MTGWRLDELIREGIRNVVAGLARSLMTGVVVFLSVAALVLAELSTTTGIIDFQEGFERRGGWVLVATSQTGGLAAYDCESLDAAEWIVESGGVVEEDAMATGNAPGTLFQTGSLTLGALEVWSGQSSISSQERGDVILGALAAAELGVRAGSNVKLRDETATVTAVVDTTFRNPSANRWVIELVAPLGIVDECWVETVPWASDAARQSIEVVLSSSGADVSATPWMRLDDFSRNPHTELAGRPQAAAWLLVGAVIVLVFWIVAWFRRSELALYSALGSRRAALWVALQTEATAIVIPSAAAGYLWMVAGFSAVTDRTIGLDQLLLAGRSAGSAALLAVVLAPLAVSFFGWQPIGALLKDR